MAVKNHNISLRRLKALGKLKCGNSDGQSRPAMIPIFLQGRDAPAIVLAGKGALRCAAFGSGIDKRLDKQILIR